MDDRRRQETVNSQEGRTPAASIEWRARCAGDAGHRAARL